MVERNPDPYHLARFLDAQEEVYSAVVSELRSGTKRSHWMWFVFPQLAGLGTSPTAQYYAVKDLAEAKAYIHHPVLGERLLRCTETVNALKGRTVQQVFGPVDAVKFKSSMTLFELAAGDPSPYAKALEKYFHSERDVLTVRMLAAGMNTERHH